MLPYDGAQAVQARGWDGTVVWTATWGPGVDRLVSVEKDGREYFALDDGKGSVVGWLDGTDNEVVARADYTPEGLARYVDEVAGSTCEELNGARCDKPLGLPFGFHTAYASKVTGLLYFRNRWYSPEANQWLSQDPLDAVDSFNLYAFNGFDSVNFVDPWGLAKNNATNQGRPPTDEEKKTCAEYGVSPADCGDIIEIEVPKEDEEAADDCRGVRCGAAGPGGGLLNLGEGIWVAKEPSRPKPHSPKAAAPKPPLSSMKPEDIAKEVAAMSDAELELIQSRIEAPLKMDRARARALDGALHQRFRPEDFPNETARRNYVDSLLDNYVHGQNGAPGVDDQVTEQAYNTIGSHAAEELGANAKGMAVGGAIGAVGRTAKGILQGIRNSHLAGKTHPTTGIPFDKDGFPDFSSVTRKQVRIKYTGSRQGDFKAANEAAGFKETPRGYTWHHHQDGATMQLVPKDVHIQTGHTGGFSLGAKLWR